MRCPHHPVKLQGGWVGFGTTRIHPLEMRPLLGILALAVVAGQVPSLKQEAPPIREGVVHHVHLGYVTWECL
jgi:hypothetical protein